MRRLNLPTTNFCAGRAVNPWTALAVLLLAMLSVFSGWRQWDLQALRNEVAQLEDKLIESRRMAEREARRLSSPEERKLHEMLGAQNAEDRLRPDLLRELERAWTPRVAIMNLNVERAGQAAQLELMAANLSEVFAFVARLNEAPGPLRATVVRHGIKSGDTNLATMATVRVQTP